MHSKMSQKEFKKRLNSQFEKICKYRERVKGNQSGKKWKDYFYRTILKTCPKYSLQSYYTTKKSKTEIIQYLRGKISDKFLNNLNRENIDRITDLICYKPLYEEPQENRLPKNLDCEKKSNKRSNRDEKAFHIVKKKMKRKENSIGIFRDSEIRNKIWEFLIFSQLIRFRSVSKKIKNYLEELLRGRKLKIISTIRNKKKINLPEFIGNLHLVNLVEIHTSREFFVNSILKKWGCHILECDLNGLYKSKQKEFFFLKLY